MAKNLTSFAAGNKIGLTLTEEISRLFINTVKICGRVSIAAGRCDLTVSTVNRWLKKGREENAEPLFSEFATGVARAHSEFLAVAAKRLAQLAIGGILDLPKYDRQNQIVRDANGEIVFEERFFPPNPNALMHLLDRLDPPQTVSRNRPASPTSRR